MYGLHLKSYEVNIDHIILFIYTAKMHEGLLLYSMFYDFDYEHIFKKTKHVELS